MCLPCRRAPAFLSFFFFNDTATTEIYTLSLHDALPISPPGPRPRNGCARSSRLTLRARRGLAALLGGDRKSTRLNSSHGYISYAVFCLEKKKNRNNRTEGTPSPAQ